MAKVVAVHQPNFYPWLGFFNKWLRADIFVLLDDGQFPKTGGTWTNRCGILLNGRRTWFTASIKRAFHGVATVEQIELMGDAKWRERLMRTFDHAYARTAHYKSVRELLAVDLLDTQSHLLELNLRSLRRIGSLLNLDAGKLVLASSLGIRSVSTDRLCDIVRSVGGSSYLSGDGAVGYQDETAFAKAGVSLVRQRFQQLPYHQSKTENFVPGLSVLDVLCNVGREGTRALMLGREAT